VMGSVLWGARRSRRGRSLCDEQLHDPGNRLPRKSRQLRSPWKESKMRVAFLDAPAVPASLWSSAWGWRGHRLRLIRLETVRRGASLRLFVC
jgi:hypothetical protein